MKCRLKDVCLLNNKSLTDTTSPNYVFKYIDISNVSSDGIITLSDDMFFGDSPSRARRIVMKGDVLISTVRTYLKAIGTINWEAKDVIASTGFAVLTPKKSLNAQYLAYATRADSFVDKVCANSYGVSYPAINASSLITLSAPIPSLSEQSRIVSYLDSKTSAIDSRISLLEQKCEAYDRLKKSIINDVITRGLNPNVKMKDSGVEWIGEIPEHWKIRRIKELANIGSGTTPKSSDDKYYEGGIHPWLNTSDVQDCHITKAQFFITDEAMNDYKGLRYYPEKTVLLAMYGGGTIGNVAVMDITATINQACCAMVIKTKAIIPDYLFYFLNCHKQKIISFGFGATQDNLSQSLVAQLPVVLPPIEEQRLIVEYITQKKANLDSAISILNAQIERYKLLKRSIINEVITGQRKVD